MSSVGETAQQTHASAAPLRHIAPQDRAPLNNYAHVPYLRAWVQLCVTKRFLMSGRLGRFCRLPNAMSCVLAALTLIVCTQPQCSAFATGRAGPLGYGRAMGWNWAGRRILEINRLWAGSG